MPRVSSMTDRPIQTAHIPRMRDIDSVEIDGRTYTGAALRLLLAGLKPTDTEVLALFKRNCVSYSGNFEVTPGQALRIAATLAAAAPPQPVASKGQHEEWIRTDDQGLAKITPANAGAAGTSGGLGAHQHHEHRTGQPDADRTGVAGDSGSAGVSSADQIREVVAPQPEISTMTIAEQFTHGIAQPVAQGDADPVASIESILYQCDRGNVSLSWLIDALRGIAARSKREGEES